MQNNSNNNAFHEKLEGGVQHLLIRSVAVENVGDTHTLASILDFLGHLSPAEAAGVAKSVPACRQVSRTNSIFG
jgi:hypothetical protein